MNTTKRSTVWKIPRNEFIELVTTSSSLSESLRRLKLFARGGNYLTLKRRITEEGIDISHIRLGKNSNKERKFGHKRSIEAYLIYAPQASKGHIKKRLIEEHILENKCAICGIDPIWQDKRLVLILDHINGDHKDFTKDNLRLLCPNCNSQTDTFAGRNNCRVV